MRSVNNVCSKGVTHKPRGQLKGEGLAKRPFYNIPKLYLVKVTAKGERVKIPKNLATWFMDDPKSYEWVFSLT